MTNLPEEPEDAELGLGEFEENQAPRPLSTGPDVIKKSRRRVSLNDHRVRLTWGLIVLAAVIAIGSALLLAYLPEPRLNSLREILPIVYSPIITLAGTSFAWFFATTDRKDSSE